MKSVHGVLERIAPRAHRPRQLRGYVGFQGQGRSHTEKRYSTSAESRSTAQRMAKGGEHRLLPFGLDSIEESGQRLGRERRKRKARRDLNIALTASLVHDNAIAIMAPHFGDAQLRPETQLRRGTVRDVHFDNDVGWRIDGQVEPVPSNDVCGVLHVKAGVWLATFPQIRVLEGG